MVLRKRTRNDELADHSSPDQPRMSMSQQANSLPSVEDIPPPKRTRTNPPRSARATISKTTKAPAVKKKRASRAKKSSAPSQPTTSAVPEAGPSPPPPKKGRKKADPAADANGSQPEKRGAVFKSKCPQNILDRQARVMTQRCVHTSRFGTLSSTLVNESYLSRIFMIDRNRIEGQLREEFSVLGSTGNVSDFRKSDVS